MKTNTKIIAILALALAVACCLSLLTTDLKPQVGSRYAYVNSCNYSTEPWEEKPVPYVQMLTVLEVKEGHAICKVFTMWATGEVSDWTRPVSFKMLRRCERLSR